MAIITGTSGADNLVGTTENDWIAGGAGNDILIGALGKNHMSGGAGNDVLVSTSYGDVMQGGSGDDIYIYAGDLQGNIYGGDLLGNIMGFSTSDDHIRLDNDVFTAFGIGALADGGYVVGAAAADANDRIIYNSETGALYYDADGNGEGAAIQFTTLDAGLALTAAHFSIID